MAKIHSSSIVHPDAELSPSVEVGPYCNIGSDVRLDDDVHLHSHVVIGGHTRVGARTHVFPFACLGLRPQDRKYAGEPSELVIGSDNVIREYVTMNPGTRGGGMLTSVGDGGLFMATVHVAHDCRLGDGVVMANNVTLGGHVHVGHHAVLGGLSAVHQYVRIGEHAMVGGLSGVENDVIPYGSVIGNRAYLSGLNNVGMKRHGIAREEIRTLRNAYRLLFAPEGEFADRLNEVAELYGDQKRVMDIVNFIRTPSTRSICQSRNGRFV